ncbi:hypothetical protein M9H77_32374 [Catharanthus roseus]|uniref:Uncharacterized protein n=1 Tax=Catharanthus roseus TaxID=4058 RepID=A0ACC0A5G8_CATRO|nr:hypothetical protein M9H77_32374 [Catharanthus roseus]
MGCFDCFGGGASKQQRREEEELASQEARAKAAEAAQKRQEQFEQSAAGRAARAQMAAAAKQSANTNKGDPVLKKNARADAHLWTKTFIFIQDSVFSIVAMFALFAMLMDRCCDC